MSRYQDKFFKNCRNRVYGFYCLMCEGINKLINPKKCSDRNWVIALLLCAFFMTVWSV